MLCVHIVILILRIISDIKVVIQELTEFVDLFDTNFNMFNVHVQW